MLWQIAAVASAAVALALGFWLVHLKIQIHGLAASVRRIRAGERHDAVSVTLLDPQLHDLAQEIEELRLLIQEDRARERRIRATAKEQLSGVVHDLRTPLVALRGFLQLARQASGDDTAVREAHLAVAETKVDLMARYISEYFDIVTIESGDVATEIEPIDVIAALGEVLADCINAHGDPEHELTVDVPDHAVVVLADRAALRRVLQNLVTNALEHASGPASIVLADGQVPTITIDNEADNLRPDEVDLLFERGYRADRSRAGAHAGVGLAVVAGLVEQMPMTVAVALDEHRFRITLALTRAGGPSRSPDVQAPKR